MIIASRLPAKWRLIWGNADPNVRRHVGPLIEYLVKKGVAPTAVEQRHFNDWKNERTGTATTVGHLNTVVNAYGQLRGLDRLPLPPLDRVSNVHDKRREENAAIEPGLLSEIKAYIAYVKSTKLDAATAVVIENRLLDGGRILTSQNWSRPSFASTFATDEDVKRFIAFFEPDPSKRTAIVRRRRIMGDIRDLVLQGKSYDAYQRLKRFYQSLPKGGNALAVKTIERISVADASTMLETTVDVILTARNEPTWHNLAAARGALAVLAISAETCRRGELATLAFAGPEKTYGPVTRPALVFTPHFGSKPIALEEDGTGDTLSLLVTAFWTTTRAVYGRKPCWVFENDDGSQQHPTTITNAVTRVTKLAGAAMSPTDAIALNVDAILEKCDLADWEIADLLRYSGQTNFRGRFRLLQQRKAAIRAAAGARASS